MDNSTTLKGEADVLFEVTTVKYEPVTAYQMIAKYGRVVIPAVVAAKAGATIDVMAGVEALFAKLTPEMANAFMLDSLVTTTVVREDEHGNKENIALCNVKGINRAFRDGNLRVMLETIWHAIEVNYGRFFVVSAPKGAPEKPVLPSL